MLEFEAINLQLLYTKGMTKRIKGFTYIDSQNISEFLSVDNWIPRRIDVCHFQEVNTTFKHLEVAFIMRANKKL